MGNAHSHSSSKKIKAGQVVAEAYLYVTQDISQGVNSSQIVSIDCLNDKEVAQKCLDCGKAVADMVYEKGGTQEEADAEVKKLCIEPCQCNMEDINLTQTITVNFDAINGANAKQLFTQSVENSIYNEANQQTKGLTFGNRDKVVSNISNQIFEKLKLSNVSTSLQQLKNIQVISLKSPGNLTAVNAKQAIDYVSTVLQSSSETSNLITQLETEILNASAQVTKTGLKQLAVLMVLIFMVIIAIIMFAMIVNLLFQLYTLYVSK